MGPLQRKVNSTGATRLIEFAETVGVPVATAPGDNSSDNQKRNNIYGLAGKSESGE